MRALVFLLLALTPAAAAVAAELPSQSAAAPQKAKKCDIGGVPGMILPGTDTCVKVSGGVGVEVGAVQRKPGYVPTVEATPAN